MIKTLRIGKIEGVEALIEVISNSDVKEVLLEKVQSQPHYHNEELCFHADGSLKSISRVRDEAYDPKKGIIYQSKIAIEVFYRQGLIKINSTSTNKDLESKAKHTIEEAYHLAKKFKDQLKSLKVDKKDEQKKKEMETLVDKIAAFSPSPYFFFTVK